MTSTIPAPLTAHGTDSHLFDKSSHRRRMLVAFAHPDDESFGPSGTILHYTKNKVSVHYACGTRGEAGEIAPEYLAQFGDAAALRSHELLQAAQILDFSGVHFLNYRDSGMENSPDNKHPHSLCQAPLSEVTFKLVRLIRWIKPQVIVTFDPSGGYFHPDHIKMHQAATLAFHISGSAQYPDLDAEGLEPYQAQKLYFVAFPRQFVRFMVRLMPLMGQDPRAFGQNKDINLLRIAQVDQKVTSQIDVFPYFAQRSAAAACHASQNFGGSIVPAIVRKYLFRHDNYTRVVPPVTNNDNIETDLFADVFIDERH